MIGCDEGGRIDFRRGMKGRPPEGKDRLGVFWVGGAVWMGATEA